jgi:hypothetical protein
VELNALYRESLPFRGMNYIVALLAALVVGELGVVIYNSLAEPIGPPELTGVFLGEALLLGAVAIFIRQFRRLDIVLTYDAVILRFGRIKKTVPWSAIDSYRVITQRRYLTSGGWRLNLGAHGWQEEYTVLGSPRIELALNTGRIRRVLFSTANPQEIAGVVRKRTGKEETRAAGPP